MRVAHYRLLLSLFIATAVLSSACVSQGTYDMLQQEKDALAQELETARTANADCNDKLGACETERDQLKADAKSTDEKLAALLKDKAQLDASVEQMTSALAELKKSKALADARIKEFRGLVEKFRKLIDAGRLNVKIVDGRMIVELATDILFASGSAKLSKDGKQAIEEVTKILNTIKDRRFQIEGHTDNVPIRKGNNWELAADRALSVLQTMLKAGMDPTRVSGATFGETRPAVPNTSKENKKKNRRIEIVIVPDLSKLPGFEELSRIAKEK